MSEAAAALDLGLPGMSGLADRMEVLGLIERRRDETDGRVWRLWLTDQGKTAAERSKANLAKMNALLADGFSEAEIEVVARWLQSLQDKFPAADE